MPIRLSDLNNAGTIKTSTGHEFQIRCFTYDDLSRALKLRSQGKSHRDFLEKVISNQINDPNPSQSQLTGLSDKEIVELAEDFLSLNLGGSKQSNIISTTDNSISEIRYKFDSLIDEENARLEKSTEAIASNINKMFRSPNLDVFYPTRLVNVGESLNTQLNWANSASKRMDALSTPSIYSVSDRIQHSSIQWLSSLAVAQDRINSMYAHLFDPAASINMSLKRIMTTISTIDLSSIVWGLDSLLQEEDLEWIEEVRGQHRSEFLMEANLNFMTDLSNEAISEIVDSALDIPANKRAAHITRRLHGFTTSEDFTEALICGIEDSSTARRRGSIVRAAHAAHKQRQYLLSIPVLLAQTEGLTVELMGSLGFVKWDRKDRRWYELDRITGKFLEVPKRKNGVKTDQMTRVPVRGLGALQKYIPRMETNPLPSALPYVRDDVSAFRNSVMHGTHTTYGNSQRSSALLILVHLISQELHKLEE